MESNTLTHRRGDRHKLLTTLLRRSGSVLHSPKFMCLTDSIIFTRCFLQKL